MYKNLITSILLALGLVFVIALSVTTYRYYQAIHSDDPIDPYLSVEEGTATITRGDIAIDMTQPETYDLREQDIIITHAHSQAVVAWPDHSTTRLGPDSRLTIQRMRVAADYSHIELVASLESGQAWSNIVRALPIDSRVEFHIPRTGTVAGVRGTVFSIDLTHNQVASIDHSVTLENSLGQIVSLLPGEAVQADNILQKITTTLDASWVQLNTVADAAYTRIRDTELRSVYTRLATSSGGILDLWDRFVRWILSFFSGFDSIATLSAIHSGDISRIVDLPQATVMRWYQTFQSTDFVQERDQFRGAIISLRDQFTHGDQIIESLMRGSLWDMTTASGDSLHYTRGLLDAYAQKSGTTLETLVSGIKTIDTNTITESGKRLIQQMLK
jgi:FecR protein